MTISSLLENSSVPVLRQVGSSKSSKDFRPKAAKPIVQETPAKITTAFNPKANLYVTQVVKEGETPLQIPPQSVVDNYARIKQTLKSKA